MLFFQKRCVTGIQCPQVLSHLRFQQFKRLASADILQLRKDGSKIPFNPSNGIVRLRLKIGKVMFASPLFDKQKTDHIVGRNLIPFPSLE
jgi:hypothetical protein